MAADEHAVTSGRMAHGRAVWLMVLVTLMWATAGVVTRHLEHARSFEVTFWRASFTVLSLLVILPTWRGRAVFSTIRQGNRSLWVSGVCWSVMFTAYMVALTLTSVANVLVTMALAPLFTALAARLFLGLVQLAIPCVFSVMCARVLKAPELSLLALLEVIFGIALAWLGAGEEPAFRVLAGGTVVIAALVGNEWLGLSRRSGKSV